MNEEPKEEPKEESHVVPTVRVVPTGEEVKQPEEIVLTAEEKAKREDEIVAEMKRLKEEADARAAALTAQEAKPKVKIPGFVKPKRAKKQSRGDRFTDAAQAVLDAVAEARTAWEQVQAAYEDAKTAYDEAAVGFTDQVTEIENALQDLRDIRSEYEDWQSNLPENLQQSALGEKLDTICGIDLEPQMPELPELDDLEEPDLDTIESAAQECLDADLPQVFGRD